MNRIPVKIVQYTLNGEARINVMIDIMNVHKIEGNAEKKIISFKKKIF